MDIREKINMDRDALVANGAITIVAFGDSVTHGALRGEIDYESVYWNRLKKKINAMRDYVPVNVINAGIGGLTAKDSLARMDRDVLAHSPDLVIVAFGLNDVNLERNEYIDSLAAMFKRFREIPDVVFMTPNMLNTYVAEDTEEEHREYARKTAEMQCNGRMDLYMKSAVETAQNCEVKVCDCYSRWKQMYQSGVDTTKLLVNRINHPEREMHQLFADSLFETIFPGQMVIQESDSTMCQN